MPDPSRLDRSVTVWKGPVLIDMFMFECSVLYFKTAELVTSAYWQFSLVKQHMTHNSSNTQQRVTKVPLLRSLVLLTFSSNRNKRQLKLDGKKEPNWGRAAQCDYSVGTDHVCYWLLFAVKRLGNFHESQTSWRKVIQAMTLFWSLGSSSAPDCVRCFMNKLFQLRYINPYNINSSASSSNESIPKALRTVAWEE